MASYFTRKIYTRIYPQKLLPVQNLFRLPLFLTVPLLPFSNFFTDSCSIFPIRCHLFHSCHAYQLSNPQFSLSCLFLCFSFFSFHRSFPLSPNFRTVSHLSTLSSKCSLSRILLQFQSLLLIPSFTSIIFGFSSGIRFQAASADVFFLLSFVLALGSSR